MGHKRQFNPKAFATGTDRCPVKLYRLFVSHRPKSMCCDQSPFFLAVRYNIDNYNSESIWYHPKPLGKNTIGEFLTKARVTLRSVHPSTSKGKISNHSARKTSITNMLNCDVNPLHVQQMSGHKNLESLHAYNVASMKQQKHMSNVISLGEKNTNTIPDHPSNNVIDQLLEKELSKPWDPVLNTVFHGASFQNCTFNITVNTPSSSQPPRKRRRLVIDDSSDSE